MTFPRNHNRLLARFHYARQRLDRGVDLMQEANDLREQLGWGLDLDDMTAAVDSFKRGVAAYRQEAS